MAKVILAVLLMTVVASAQEAPGRTELLATGGITGFLDEDADISATFGGAVRRYLTRRISLAPEFLYLVGQDSIRDLTLIPNVAYDFNDSRLVRPYLIGGLGWYQHRQPFGGTMFVHNEWTVSGGAGVKLFLTPRVFVAPEFRIGFEPIFRIAGSVGWSF